MASYAEMINKLSKDWACPDMMNVNKDECAKIPFSSPLLNYATHGGVPRDAITEFHGVNGGGKSTTCVDICKNAVELFQKEFDEQADFMRQQIAQGNKSYVGPLEDLMERGPKKVVYGDLEHSFDRKWAHKMGLNDGEIDVMQPPNISGEAFLQAVQDLIETGEIGLFIIDSVPSLVCQAEWEKKYGERTVASLAGLLTNFTRKIVPILTRYNCTLILVNQIRDNMDNPYVVNTPGGQALKFYSQLRLHFRLGAPLDFAGNEVPANTENPAGYLIQVKVIKNKKGGLDRKNASYFLMFDSGIRPDFDYAQLAVKKYNIIQKSGAWFTLCDPFTGEQLEEDGKPVKINGMIKVYDYLACHPEYYNKLKRYIEADINDEPINEEESTDEEHCD